MTNNSKKAENFSCHVNDAGLKDFLVLVKYAVYLNLTPNPNSNPNLLNQTVDRIRIVDCILNQYRFFLSITTLIFHLNSVYSKNLVSQWQALRQFFSSVDPIIIFLTHMKMP